MRDQREVGVVGTGRAQDLGDLLDLGGGITNLEARGQHPGDPGRPVDHTRGHPLEGRSGKATDGIGQDGRSAPKSFQPRVAVVPGEKLGAGGWRLYRYVLLPASLPALASGLRQGFSFAWRSLMGAEFVFVIQRHGLGYLLQTGRDFNDVAQVLAIMIMMVVLGMLADRLAFAKLEKRVYHRFGLTTAK